MLPQLKPYILATLLLLLCAWSNTLQAATTQVHGTVIDSLTHQPIPFVAIYLKGTTTGAMTDDKGSFALAAPTNASQTLVATSLGYTLQEIPLHPHTSYPLHIALLPTTYQMDEVVIKPQKEKYSRKNNPAVELAKVLIENRQKNSPYNHPHYQHERYEKTTLALNEFSQAQKDKWIFQQFKFIFNYVDTSEISGKPILNVSVNERVANRYYTQQPYSNKEIVTGTKQVGIEESINPETMHQFYSEVFQEVDIFESDVTIFLKRFVSPLSSIGTQFYKYYLLDTVQIGGKPYIDLGFVPFNSESFGFTGHLYVAPDSTHFIKRIELSIPQDINLNFVETLTLTQQFDQAPDGTRLIQSDDIVAEFRLAPGSQGLYARRLNMYQNHSFDPPPTHHQELLQQPLPQITKESAHAQPLAFWADKRQTPIKEKESAVSLLLEELRQIPLYYYTERLIVILISGYIQTEPDNSKFDLGPMNTTIGGNTLEGVRLRLGGTTTAKLHPQLFAKGYVAYGFSDEQLKYATTLEYSFNKKKNHAREFPIHSVQLSHSYDINQLGQQYLYTNKDNVFVALKRTADTLNTYLSNTAIKYQRELLCGFSYYLDLAYKTEYTSPYVAFDNSSGISLSHYNMALATLGVRYAYNEKFYHTRVSRHSVNLDSPIFTLSHTMAQQGLLGSDYTLHRTELGMQKRFWLSAFGYLTLFLRSGKVWSTSPYPLLIIPNANLSYTLQYESYPLMNALEFVNDSYFSWDISYNMDGLLCNRIPLVKYLKAREVLTFRGLYGSLSDSNNPTLNTDLFTLPTTTYLMDSKIPYMEAGIGVENIFKILRVDYIRRLTYLDNPNISKWGIRIALTFDF